MNNIPNVKVGILSKSALEFTLYGQYKYLDTTLKGIHKAWFDAGEIIFDGKPCKEVLLEPIDPENCHFGLNDVTIGVNFHWQRTERQCFKGSLMLLCENSAITAINIINIEEYLLSVISSEMSATSSLEFLKAHAVISRSWLVAQIKKKANIAIKHDETVANSDEELIKWYDREDHKNFDVCADDHCQRYQGINRESTDAVRQAIDATRGEVLMYDGELCDTRFSKCCGGVYELFENCWEPVHHDYLEARRDGVDENNFPDLTKEENAAHWIMSYPKAYCNTNDKNILTQVLNNYDQETSDFYRWKIEYTQEQISQHIKERSGIDFGQIIDLQPIARGTSGRLYKMKIVGSKRSLIIGKELEIRRTLSKSHLYSSAFIVERHNISDNGIPQKFVLRGAGWGHGVGLCQIGAAVMGEKGYSYRQILFHYFKNATITKLYDRL